MKKKYMKLMLVGLFFMSLFSCDPKVYILFPPVTYPTYDAPNWSVSEKSAYEYTMTAVVVLPDSLRSGEDASDKLAVFAQDECRGVAEKLEVSEGKYVWMAMVYGKEDVEELCFKYYSAKSKHMFVSAETTSFVIDGNWGTIDEPKMVGMKIRTE